MHVTRLLLAGLAGLTVSASFASAAFTTPSWTRPADNAAAAASYTTYQGWDLFFDEDIVTAGVQDNTPDVANINPNGTAGLATTSNAIITGTGNLYSFSTTPTITVNVPSYNLGSAASTTFFVQINVTAAGNPLLLTPGDYSAFSVDGVAISTLPGFAYQTLGTTDTSGGLGNDHGFTFTLPGSAASHSFSYSPSGAHSSQAIITIDTLTAVPEPASLAAIAGGAFAMLLRRRNAR